MTKQKIWHFFMQACAPTCHQKATRCFFIGKYQMPICSRCLGLYIGLAVGFWFYIPKSLILIPITYIDGLIQLKTNYVSTNRRRLITGILSGWGIIQFVKLIFFLIF